MRRTGLSKSSSSKFKHPASNLKLSLPVEAENADPNCSIEKPQCVQLEKRPTESENEPITAKRSRDALEVNPSDVPDAARSIVQPVAKKPALLHQNQKTPSQAAKPEPTTARLEYWTCLHTKMTNKKHPTYDDGVIGIKNNACELFDMDNKLIGKTTFPASTLDNLQCDTTLTMAGKIVVLQQHIPVDDFTSGRIFIGKSNAAKDPDPPVVFKDIFSNSNKSSGHLNPQGYNARKRTTPLYDPLAPNALVLYAPTAQSDSELAVVLDPRLDRTLRPHQREGVKFLYDCVTGASGQGTGCILADEMGLGKTLQSICLLRTLLQQGPNGLPLAKRVIIVTPSSLVKNWGNELKKWLGKERVGALLIGDQGKKESRQSLHDFKFGAVNQVLVLSYEQCRRNIDLLQDVEFGLLICDEGHRLRNPQNKTTRSVNDLKAKRRILLSGTPFQNNLNEFYSLIEFCNPGVLGSPEKFRKIFAIPIEKSRDASCSEAVKKLGRERAAELHTVTKQFMLRRTQEVLERFLPARNDLVIFCQPSKLQNTCYKEYLQSDDVHEILFSGSYAVALICIILLKKLCNHPELIYAMMKDTGGTAATEFQRPGPSNSTAKSTKNAKTKKSRIADDEIEDMEEDCVMDGDDASEDERGDAMQRQCCAKTNLLSAFPPNFDCNGYHPELSGKLEVLDEMLRTIKTTSKDRVVIVSFFKQTLNILQKACQHHSYQYLRLDGDTLAKNRQDLVDSFNRPDSPYFIFLLSTKAGGEGLNLIGANRLIIFDCDWNPSYERQAMARIWRDGQKKEVWIYRLILAGTIEEKIFQRQMVKQALSAEIISAEQIDDNFTQEDLKDIFSFTENVKCETYDLLKHKKSSRKQMVIDALKEWKFHPSKEKSRDPLLVGLESSKVSFVFEKSSKPDDENDMLCEVKLDSEEESSDEVEVMQVS